MSLDATSPTRTGLVAGFLVLAAASAYGAAPEEPLAAGFAAVRPLMARYCVDCHAGAEPEGEIDLDSLDALESLRRHPTVVQRVEEMVSSGQMPPPDAEQPTEDERRILGDWLGAFLAAEARAHAGDPGRVVLRRLNNAEYTHSIRDLTGVGSLDPAREFPADGGAGEGFTNTGQSLVMSPSLVAKYLDAAKGIAAHAVLLPDSITFSAGDSRRDFSDDWVARTKAFYGRYTQSLAKEERAGQTTVQQGITLDKGAEGFLPVERYIRTTLELRDREPVDAAAIAAVARGAALSPKYLATLWNAVSGSDSESVVLDHVRSAWRSATPADAGAVAAVINRWQNALWKFNLAGQIGRHLGRKDGPASWQEAVSPLVAEKEFRFAVPAPAREDRSPCVTVHLAAGDAGDGTADDVVVFRSPRLVSAGLADLPLRDVRAFAVAFPEWRQRMVGTAKACLAAAGEALAAESDASFDDLVGSLAKTHGVDVGLLRGWCGLAGLGAEPAAIDLLRERNANVGGFDVVGGWKAADSLSVIVNASDRVVELPVPLPPRSVVVNPAPTRRVVLGWRSPITGRVRIESATRRLFSVCGDGTSWDLQVRRGRCRQALASGSADKNRQGTGPFEVFVRRGDMVCLSVGARGGDNTCDSTAVDLTIEALGPDAGEVWDLGKDCGVDPLESNPRADSRGRAAIWHFGSQPDAAGSDPFIPRDSLFARWLSAGSAEERAAHADSIAALLERTVSAAGDETSAGGKREPPEQQSKEQSAKKQSPDELLARLLVAPSGPVLGPVLAQVARQGAAGGHARAAPAGAATGVGLDPAVFGRDPDGSFAAAIGPDDLCLRPPHGVAVEIPRELAEQCEFVTTACLPPGAGPQASIQPWAGLGPLPATGFSASAPIVVADPSPARERFTRGLAEFREIFPKALCYARIVPVDEVITFNLYYREDEHLRRLVLDDAEAAELDRLWDELLYVAQEPLEFEDLFEQIEGFYSQGAEYADQAESPVAPMKPAVLARAEAFRKRLVDTEPRHVDAVVGFAGRAFRRPLEPDEEARLRGLYDTLRRKDLPHEEAIRTLLAHVLVAPEFLYKLETPGPGTTPGPVTDHELATRLSYFLWSSPPDAELAAAADSGRLHDPDVLAAQMRRMLAAPAARRLAEEFGTQWLHVHGFSTLDEKNAELFPTFAGLRADMEEETIRFLDDFFRNDRSVLSLIDADHTFLNEPLAAHYGIEGVSGPEWRRVEGVRRHGRGGILGLATTLSTQAGASRTSPILRGNWLYETVLGEKLPKPPKDVPQLAENVPAGLSERQLIAMHSEHEACAKCHRRIDPFGFALEEFDAIGRLRATDASGKPIDARATALDGAVIDGQQGLREYLLGPRRDRFVRVFCRKLLGYALGRGVQLSDEPLLDEMVARLAAHDYRVSVAIEAIVTSPQVRLIRGRDAADDAI